MKKKACRRHQLWPLLLWIIAQLIQSSPISTAFVEVRSPCPFPSVMPRTQHSCPTSTTECQQRRRRDTSTTTRLYCSVTPSPTAEEICNQLQLYDQFDRWRFLQNMLDEEVSAHDTQLVLSALLLLRQTRFLPQVSQSPDELLGEKIESALRSLDAIPDLLALEEHETNDSVASSSTAMVLLDQLEQLLPDPVEDEDAFKSLWDIVIELHGREAVKINERNGFVQWKARCLIARVLLHFDFLTEGLMMVANAEEPL